MAEQARADGVASNDADAVGQDQPSFVDLDWRTAVAQLDELPWEQRFKELISFIPIVRVIRFKQPDIFLILPA